VGVKTSINISKVTDRAIHFPLLAKNRESGVVVLFTSHTIGTLVACEGPARIGMFDDDWSSCLDESRWEILNPGESVTISQIN
jgi:hypothetical protein